MLDCTLSVKGLSGVGSHVLLLKGRVVLLWMYEEEKSVYCAFMYNTEIKPKESNSPSKKVYSAP